MQESLFYILDENKNVVPASMEEFEEFISSKAKIVKQETIEGKNGNRYFVSTVFLGVNYAMSSTDKRLAIFETKIENSTKSKWTDFEARYSTYDEALKGHENAVLQVKKRFK